MDSLIHITLLNDFIFCPASIYFHMINAETDKLTYQDEYQLNGSAPHEKSDSGKYSDKKDILQAIPVYCDKYGLVGKIDVFDSQYGILTELQFFYLIHMGLIS